MDLKALVLATEYYLPENVLSNEDINKSHPEWSVEKISAKTGIYERHIAGANEFASDLGYHAAKKLMDNRADLGEIDYLIFCTQSPDYLLPTTACLLQKRLGLDNNIGAIDINMGCSGYIYGLSYAKGLIMSGQAKKILLITSETYSKYINDLDKNNKTIFGDGASATLIGSEAKKLLGGEIKNFYFYTDGGGFDKLIVRNSGARFKKESKNNLDVLSDEGLYLSNPDNLYMDGKSIFEFTSFKVPPAIQNILDLNQLDINSIDLFIFHQANAFMMQFIRKRCKIPKDKFLVHLEHSGNTVSSTIPIALKAAIDEGRIKKNMNVLLIGFGVGLSIAGTIVRY